jgi:hypothetical protein
MDLLALTEACWEALSELPLIPYAVLKYLLIISAPFKYVVLYYFIEAELQIQTVGAKRDEIISWFRHYLLRSSEHLKASGHI